MKKLIIILLVCVWMGALNAQKSKRPNIIPTNIEETFPFLDYMMDDTLIYNFMTLPEDVSVAILHFPYGMWVRNEFKLWSDSPLRTYFIEKGIVHPDDMSGILFTSFHRYLNDKEIDVDGQIEFWKKVYETMVVDTLDENKVRVSYPALEEYYTTDDEQMMYYPLGDTVFHTVQGKKGIFKRNVNVGVLSIIESYDETKLNLKIIKIRHITRVETENKVGDIVSRLAVNCYLLPPAEWKRKEIENK